MLLEEDVDEVELEERGRGDRPGVEVRLGFGAPVDVDGPVALGGAGDRVGPVVDVDGRPELLSDGELEDVELELDVLVDEDDGCCEREVRGDRAVVVGPVQDDVAVLPGRTCCRAEGERPGSTRCGAWESAVDATGTVDVGSVSAPGAEPSAVDGSVGPPDRVVEGPPTAVDTGVGAVVLVAPAAPEPKPALRCTRPIRSATWLSTGTPLTAAATPEIDSAATVIAAATPTRADVRDVERA